MTKLVPRRRRPYIGRRVDFAILLFAILLVVFLIAASEAGTATHHENRLTCIVAIVVGRSVTITCDVP